MGESGRGLRCGVKSWGKAALSAALAQLSASGLQSRSHLSDFRPIIICTFDFRFNAAIHALPPLA
jgi:hypothetical protein